MTVDEKPYTVLPTARTLLQPKGMCTMSRSAAPGADILDIRSTSALRVVHIDHQRIRSACIVLERYQPQMSSRLAAFIACIIVDLEVGIADHADLCGLNITS